MICNDAPILIYDEDNICRHAVAEVLQKHDFFVVEASTGGQATAALEGNPRLIMVGYNRSQSAAVAWMTRLREQGNRTPIVIISSCWCDAKTFYLFRNVLNVALILQKPIAPNLLMNQLEFVLPVNASPGPASVNFHPAVSIACPEEAAGDATASTDSESVDMSDLMAEIKREYAAQLPGAWMELLTCIESVKSESNFESLPDAMGLAHKLRGNAGAYGFPQIGAIGERLEYLLGFAACADSEDRDDFWSQIVTALDEGTSIVNAIDGGASKGCAISYSQSLPKILVIGDEGRLGALAKHSFAEFVFVPDADSALARAARTSFVAAAVEIHNTGNRSDLFRLTRELRQFSGNQSMPLGAICYSVHPQQPSDLAYAGISVTIEGPIEDSVECEDFIRTLIILRQSQKRKILVIDDDVASTNFISAQLTRAGHVVHCVNEPIETFGVLATFVPDLVLLDVFMPGLSGYDVCRIMRSMPHVGSVPILFITARNEQTVRSAAFVAGASDFLCKPIVGDELVARIKCHLTAVEASTQQASKDPVTRVPVMGSKIDEMSGWLSTCRRNHVPMSLCLLKIDSWEERMLTDCPATADLILSALARLVQSRFKTEDIRARWGDAGFIIAFPAENKRTVAEALVLLRSEFEYQQFTGQDGKQFSCTLSTAEVDASESTQSLPEMIARCYRRLDKNARAKEKSLFCASFRNAKELRTKRRLYAEDISRGGTLQLRSRNCDPPLVLVLPRRWMYGGSVRQSPES